MLLFDSGLDDWVHGAVTLDRTGHDAMTRRQDALGLLAVRGCTLDFTAFRGARRGASPSSAATTAAATRRRRAVRRHCPLPDARVLMKPDPMSDGADRAMQSAAANHEGTMRCFRTTGM